MIVNPKSPLHLFFDSIGQFKAQQARSGSGSGFAATNICRAIRSLAQPNLIYRNLSELVGLWVSTQSLLSQPQAKHRAGPGPLHVFFRHKHESPCAIITA
jgi:hypothetical protein